MMSDGKFAFSDPALSLTRAPLLTRVDNLSQMHDDDYDVLRRSARG